MPPHASDNTFGLVEDDDSLYRGLYTVEHGRPTAGKPLGIAVSAIQIRKSVSFNLKVRVKPVLHVLEYSKEEFEACWYNKSEMVAFKKNAREAAKTLESVGTINCLANSNFCIRGLKTKGDKQRRIKIKKSARKSMFREQILQAVQGIYNPELLAQAYLTECRRAHVDARNAGIEDARIVQQLWQ